MDQYVGLGGLELARTSQQLPENGLFQPQKFSAKIPVEHTSPERVLQPIHSSYFFCFFFWSHDSLEKGKTVWVTPRKNVSSKNLVIVIPKEGLASRAPQSFFWYYNHIGLKRRLFAPHTSNYNTILSLDQTQIYWTSVNIAQFVPTAKVLLCK